MLPPNIWHAWYILGTAVLQSITEAVVNKVVRSWLNPLGKISPGGLRTSRRCKVNATRSPVHTATLSPLAARRFLAAFILSHLSCLPSVSSCLSAHRWGRALRSGFRLQSADLPGYTWQRAVKQDVWISARRNGFVRAPLRQTEGGERRGLQR